MYKIKNGKKEKLPYPTHQEFAEMQKNEFNQPNTELSINDKLMLIANSVEVIKPTTKSILPFKLGYKWQPIYNGSAIVWESVKDENAIGTINNPIYYVDDSPLIDNGFYIKEDGKTYIYMQGEWIELEVD